MTMSTISHYYTDLIEAAERSEVGRDDITVTVHRSGKVVYATVYVDDDPSAPFEVVVGPELDPDFLVDDWDDDGWADEEADAWHGFCYWLSQGAEPVWRFGEGTRTLRDVAESVHCDTRPTTMTPNNHPEEGQP